MEQTTIALKVDVATFAGTRDGVPRLLRILARAHIKATFYFAMGPDNSGLFLRHIFTKKGYLKKLFQSKTPSTMGFPAMLYGIILPAPMIAATLPHILRQTADAGHEVGIHCWDHAKWYDYLPWLPKPLTAMELGRASALFEEIMGRRTATTAAPGWTVTEASLEVEDALKLSFCSDARGHAPFYPVWEGRRFTTLQVPTTWPTVVELLAKPGVTQANINDHYLTMLTPGLHVHTISAELEGGRMADTLVDLLERLQTKGADFATLGTVAAAHLHTAPESPLNLGELPGLPGLIALQGS